MGSCAVFESPSKCLSISVSGVFCHYSFLFSLAQSFALAYPSVHFSFSGQSSEQFLKENEGNYKAFSFVNKNLPSDAKVLLQEL